MIEEEMRVEILSVTYYNCNSEISTNFVDGCITFEKEDSQLARDVFIGVRWQFVEEYARRWLITQTKCTFGDVTSAYQIFVMKTVEDLTKEKGTKSFLNYKNCNLIPPKMGDLIIYPVSKATPHDHVAVVSNVKTYFLDIWISLSKIMRIIGITQIILKG